MTAKQLLEARREKILQVAAKYGARNVRVFGSVARGEDRPGSDLDLLIDMEKRRTLFDFVRLWQELEETLGCSVDLIEEGGIKPRLREHILRDARPL